MSETSGFATVESAENNANLGSEQQEININEGQETTQQNDSQNSGGHPAWEDILTKENVPEAFKPMLRRTFQQWDEGIQKKFEENQQVQSQYEPYRQFVDNNIDPAQLEQAWQVLQIINDNPRGFYDHMRQFYKFDNQPNTPSGQGQQDFDNDELDFSEDEQDPYAEKFRELQQQQELIAKALVLKHQKEVDAAEDAALEEEVQRLREEKGDFNEEFVFNVAANNGGNLEAAVDKYFEIVANVQGQARPGSNFPRVVSPGGGTPQTSVNPAELSSSESKNLAVQLIQQMNQQE